MSVSSPSYTQRVTIVAEDVPYTFLLIKGNVKMVNKTF